MSETGLHNRFRSLYRQSLPGSRVNEDGCGLQGRCAWIIDGATGIGDGVNLSAPSDAAWLAGQIGDRLMDLSDAEQTDDVLLTRLEKEIGAAFEAALAPGTQKLRTDGPSACLGLLRLGEPDSVGKRHLHGLFLGDVVALVPTGQGIVRWTDERAKPFERRTLAALGGAGEGSGDVPEPVRRQILENRTKLNRPDGYWVVNPRRPWSGQELRFSAGIEAGAAIVLATDGFMRLVDVFDAYSDGTLYNALAAGGGDDLVEELRRRERQDPTNREFKRVKTHDDATVLVVTEAVD